MMMMMMMMMMNIFLTFGTSLQKYNLYTHSSSTRSHLQTSTSHSFYIYWESPHTYSPLTLIVLHQATTISSAKLSSSAMAATRLISAAVIILSFFLSATFTTGCGTCDPQLPTPKPKPAPKEPPVNPFCPRDTLKLGVCADVLGLVNVVIGAPPSGEKCCALLEGLADLEVAACLCTAIKANVLGINLNIPISLSALVSACGKEIPPGFKCV